MVERRLMNATKRTEQVSESMIKFTMNGTIYNIVKLKQRRLRWLAPRPYRNTITDKYEPFYNLLVGTVTNDFDNGILEPNPLE